MTTARPADPHSLANGSGAKLRVLIADDEPLARQRLRQFLASESNIEIVAECANGNDTVLFARKTSPDLVLLDVQMPELDGLEVIQRLGKDRLPVIIFVTAHDQYAVRAFEAHAVDYLLKPFDRERFRKALNRAREVLLGYREHLATATLCELVAALKSRRKPLESLTIKSAGRFSFVKISQIDWIRGADNYVELHVKGLVHLLRQPIGKLEQQLPADQFVRISRSLLVNLDRVKEMRSKSHGDYFLILQDGTKLTAGRTYRATLQRLLDKPF